jgi:hypothetical protein
MQKHWDKALNNALIAKVLEFCANSHIEWVMYGCIGNHPTLDDFKLNNGFSQFQLTRYYMRARKTTRKYNNFHICIFFHNAELKEP